MKIFLLCFVLCSVAQAKSLRMVQGGKIFLGDVTDAQAAAAYDDPEIEEKYKVISLTAKVGDEITFVNRDEVSHNVSGSLNSKTIFDVKLQEPGKANDRSVKLTDKGEYSIQCAIHPKMKFKVKVD